MEKWINVVETYPEPPSKEKEFNEWYNGMHVPDAVNSPDYVGAARYVSYSGKVIYGRGKYLALYFIQTENIDQTMKKRFEKRVVEIQKGRHTDTCVNTWVDVLYREIGHTVSSRQQENGQNWINMVEMNCDPKREDEFLEWYLKLYLPEMAGSEGIVGATACVHKQIRDGRGKYMTLFAIKTNDIEETMNKWDKKHQQVMVKDPRSETSRIICESIIFRSIFEYFPSEGSLSHKG